MACVNLQPPWYVRIRMRIHENVNNFSTRYLTIRRYGVSAPKNTLPVVSRNPRDDFNRNRIGIILSWICLQESIRYELIMDYFEQLTGSVSPPLSRLGQHECLSNRIKGKGDLLPVMVFLFISYRRMVSHHPEGTSKNWFSAAFRVWAKSNW